MLLSEMAAMRIWSNARVKKAAKVLQNGTVLLRVAQPTAMLTWGQVGQVSSEGQAEGGQEPRTLEVTFWGAEDSVILVC